MHHVLLEDLEANGFSDAIDREQDIEEAREYGSYQVSFAGSAGGNVVLQGRLSRQMEWEDLAIHTVDGVTRVSIMPQFRCVLTGYSGAGAIRAELEY